MAIVRLFNKKDWPAVWGILKQSIAEGETLAYPPDSSESYVFEQWVDKAAATFVLTDDTGISLLGSYYIRPNQPGLGSHVANCGYVVDELARGQGVAREMCIHSQTMAKEMGFRAMQFNLVVSTNQVALNLWKKLGFDVVGTLPGAFRHSRQGYVDASILYKIL